MPVIRLVLFLVCINFVSLVAEPIISLSSTNVKPGSTIKIHLKNRKPLQTCIIQFDQKNLTLFPKDAQHDQFDGYIGISRFLTPGTYTLSVITQTQTSLPEKIDIPITVLDGKFPHSHITLIGTKKALFEKEDQLSNEGKLIEKTFTILTPKLYFSGSFRKPASGKISAEFGAYRIYNQQKETQRHAGIDIANKINCPVMAANTGKVVFAEALQSHGNTIIIDHGWGILSIYNHLNTILVTQNQTVKIGEKIGLMGSTGISTGPHVHWGMSVQGTRVDPSPWITSTVLCTP
ncbi:MAG: M23 family metallopeptidase [Candidatus Margulisbacteria bacterium]|nr:M23 family metallopeptidase [Candidatus Margulisiibacteriota bacterium]